MVQIVLPNGGITSIDLHEINSFADMAGVTLPLTPAGADPATVDPFLVAVKLDQPPGVQ